MFNVRERDAFARQWINYICTNHKFTVLESL